MNLSRLPKLKGKDRKAKRVGRGIGSGKGSHTSGRGQKGQKARTGGNIPVGFEGGQVPLYKKMPKIKGFFNPHNLKRVVVNISELEVFEDGLKISPSDLVKAGIIKTIPEHGVKILGDGKLTKKLSLEGFVYSTGAVEKIKKAGGETK